nr:MAG TPA: hypothetical protein [Caudoviricetes sp.]
MPCAFGAGGGVDLPRGSGRRGRRGGAQRVGGYGVCVVVDGAGCGARAQNFFQTVPADVGLF